MGRRGLGLLVLVQGLGLGFVQFGGLWEKGLGAAVVRFSRWTSASSAFCCVRELRVRAADGEQSQDQAT